MKEKQQLALEGRYLEAEALKQKVNEIREMSIINRKKELIQMHNSELRNLEEAYNKEINELIKYWTEIYNQFDEKYKAYEENLNKRLKEEMFEYINVLENKFSSAVKYSKEYLDLKDTEANLVKAER
jgi:hypothetical protein